MTSSPAEITDKLEQLRTQHREADLRLQELERHLSLTTEEQIEKARLKKQKLALKDEIRSLSAQART